MEKGIHPITTKKLHGSISYIQACLLVVIENSVPLIYFNLEQLEMEEKNSYSCVRQFFLSISTLLRNYHSVTMK